MHCIVAMVSESGVGRFRCYATLIVVASGHKNVPIHAPIRAPAVNNVCVCVCAWVYVCMCGVYVCIRMCVCVCVCMCVKSEYHAYNYCHAQDIEMYLNHIIILL